MKTIEDRCREICLTGGYDPDGIAAQEYQDISFGFPVGPDGLVRVWMQWITTIEASEKRKSNPRKPHDLGKDAAKRELQEIIDRNKITQERKHEFHTQRY